MVVGLDAIEPGLSLLLEAAVGDGSEVASAGPGHLLEVALGWRLVDAVAVAMMLGSACASVFGVVIAGGGVMVALAGAASCVPLEATVAGCDPSDVGALQDEMAHTDDGRADLDSVLSDSYDDRRHHGEPYFESSVDLASYAR